MKLTKQQLQRIIKEEIIKESEEGARKNAANQINKLRDAINNGRGLNIPSRSGEEAAVMAALEYAIKAMDGSAGGGNNDIWSYIHNSSPGDIPWHEAVTKSGYSKERLMSYIDNETDDSDKYYMKYNDDGLVLDDPTSV